jgi:hypothetical protein
VVDKDENNVKMHDNSWAAKLHLHPRGVARRSGWRKAPRQVTQQQALCVNGALFGFDLL